MRIPRTYMHISHYIVLSLVPVTLLTLLIKRPLIRSGFAYPTRSYSETTAPSLGDYQARLTRFALIRRKEDWWLSRWKRLLLFSPVLALCPLYLSAGECDYPAPATIVVIVVRNRGPPARELLPAERAERGEPQAGLQPFEDVKTQSLAVARDRERIGSHTRPPRIINTPICLHSSSYKVSQTLSSPVCPSLRPYYVQRRPPRSSILSRPRRSIPSRGKKTAREMYRM